VALVEQGGDDPHGSRTILGQDGRNHRANVLLRDRSEQGLQIRGTDRFAAEGHGLVQKAQGVSHAALAGLRNQAEATVIHSDPVLIGDVTKPLDDF
jgi:hypothetical protein